MIEMHKTVHNTGPSLTVWILSAIAVAGLYICIYSLWREVWQQSQDIRMILQIVNQIAQ